MAGLPPVAEFSSMKEKMKILGLDIGERRIGVAFSDGVIVTSGETIICRNLTEAINQVLAIIREEKIEKIVVGLPEGNQQSEDMVRSFAMDLNKLVEIDISFTSEFLTSKEAERILKSSKLKPRSEKYKRETDRISAALILEQYLKEKN